MRHTTQSLRQDIWGHEKVRFVAVGGVNTVVDFGILFFLSITLGVPVLLANIVSTSTGLTVSYLLNKKAVFGGSGGNVRRQFTLFLIVTLSGLWVLQPLIITAVEWLVADGLITPGATLLIGKLCATVVTLVWNYLWYSKVVFRKGKQ